MEVREAEGVAVTEVMGVVRVVVGVVVVVLVVTAEAMVVMVVMRVTVARSRCNRWPEGSLCTPNQGRRPHRGRCWRSCQMRSSSLSTAGTQC